MDWFQRLLLRDAPENTTLQGAELSLRGLIPIWLAGLLLAACAGGIFWLYFQERVRLSLGRRLVLALLRTAAVGLVLVLLLRPVLLAEFKGERPRSVVLLLDNTQSMQQQDRRVSSADRLRAAIARGQVPLHTAVTDSTALASVHAEQLRDAERIELVKAVLAHPDLKLVEGLNQRGPLQAYLFGRKLHFPGGDDSSSLAERLRAGLKADEVQTALADSIHELLARTGDDLPAALVVLTDGRDNASKLTLAEAAEICRDKGVALHVWGVGSSEGGILQLKDVIAPSTIFVDEKPEAKDDPIDVPVSWRSRGFKDGTVVLTLKLGSQIVRKEYPVREGEDIREVVTFVPEKGKEGQRDLTATLEMKGDDTTRDQVQKTVQVKSSKVKVLVVENLPRREYKFLEPILERDRRVLARFFLVEGDPMLAKNKPDPESGAMFLDAFPENFPDPSPSDPDQRAYNVLILGDVPLKALGPQGAAAIQKFVKEGGGLAVIAGRQHCPADYLATPLAEVLPVEFARQDFPIDPSIRTQPFKPVLTYDGEQSDMLALADKQEDNLRLWKEDLWKDAQGFYWHYPVSDLRPAARALLVHPQEKTRDPADAKPMPLLAARYYGKGEVLFLATDETWRWRHNTGDKLTARFWGQVVARLGLPHLLGNSQRVQLELERGEAVLGRPGSVRARLLDEKYNPLTLPTVPAALIALDARDPERRNRAIELRRIAGQPGEYRAALPNDIPGRFELRVEKGASLEPTSLNFRVEVPPRHELEIAGMAEETLRNAAHVGGGRFYREEDLPQLVAAVEPRKVEFVQRQEILLWNPLTMLIFIGLLTAEWTLRKFSNLS